MNSDERTTRIIEYGLAIAFIAFILIVVLLIEVSNR